MAKADTDWESIEREYRAGQMTLTEIGDIYGVSKGRISQVAKKKGWTQDLGARIQSRAAAKLNDELVNAELNAESKAASDDERVAIGAEALAKVVLGQRKSVKELRERVAKYNSELDACGDDLGERVKILKALAETEKVLIALERQSYGMKDQPEEGDKPPAPAISDLEAARRIAFALARAEKAK